MGGTGSRSSSRESARSRSGRRSSGDTSSRSCSAWYDPTAKGPDRLLEKTRFTSEAIGIDWFYLAPRGERRILSRLGLFVHNGIGRLQDVSTAAEERRKGYAGMLVSFAIRQAIETLGARGVALAADSEYHAIMLCARSRGRTGR